MVSSARLPAAAGRAGAEAGGAKALAFEQVDELISVVRGELDDGDWLLVKGSRGMRMERVVQAVTEAEGVS